jgi:hypothetical protein
MVSMYGPDADQICHVQQTALPLHSRVGQPAGVLELARHYGCSMEVARHALWILHSEGLLRKPQQGLHTRVIAVPEPEAGPNPRELLVELQEAVRGLEVKLQALDTALAKAG